MPPPPPLPNAPPVPFPPFPALATDWTPVAAAFPFSVVLILIDTPLVTLT